MYEAFFQLKHRPFAAAPQPDRYFPAQSIEAALHALARCVDRAEGPGLLVGASGTGKTLLLEMLARRFDGRFTVVSLASGNFSGRRELLQAILYELEMPYRGLDEGELRLALFQRLNPNPHCPAGILLLVDEAQRLPLRLLEELRLLGDYTRDGQPRVRLIVAGNRALEEHLTHPKLDALAQRLAVRSYLAALERGETAAFVRSQISAMGGHAERIFNGEALDAIHNATGGIPRLINQLADHALVLAYAAGRQQIDAARVEQAWSDLQQLPAPWNEAEADGGQGQMSVVEFGELDDEDEPGAVPFPQPTIPVQQSATVKLEQISAQLASLDDDFDLPEPSEPLPAPMHCDPFTESFLEEEVVLDRYATADASLADYPVVSSMEGSVLGSLLEPHLLGGERANTPAAVRLHETLHSVTIAAAPTAMPAVDGRGCSAGSSCGHACGRTTDEAEREMIVVENDPGAAQATAGAVVHRQEYRELFAKLRDGH